MTPRPVPVRRLLTVGVALGLLAPAGVAAAAGLSAPAGVSHVKVAKAHLQPLYRGTGRVPHGRVNGALAPSTSSLTASDGSQVSLVTGPLTSNLTSSLTSSLTTPQLSTWQVTYTGFTPQAQAAFQAAVNIWSGIISTPVPIKVEATFKSTSPGLLGYAGATSNVAGSGIGDGNTFYPLALANALAGVDTEPDVSDINAVFSSSEPQIYYGTDGLPPTGYIDFTSVVLHELGHGLGFAGSMEYSGGQGTRSTPPFGFDRFAQNSAGGSLLSYVSPSTALGSQLVSNALYFGGTYAKAANAGARPRLYAPSGWQPGSSYSHLNEISYPAGNTNALMTPVLNQQEVIRDPGAITRGVFHDLGYVVPAPSAPTHVVGTPNNGGAYVTWTAATTGSAATSYLVTAAPGGATQTGSATARKVTFTGLSNGTPYTFTVKAINGQGAATSLPSVAIIPAVDTVKPLSLIPSGPSGYAPSSTATFALSGSDPGRPGAVFHFLCAREGGTLQACTSPVTYTGLSSGAHTFRSVAIDESGNQALASASRGWTIDLVSPLVTTSPVSVWSTGSTVGLSYAGTDVGTGLSSTTPYDVRYRSSSYSASALSAYQYPNTSTRDWTGITAKSVSMTAAKGYTYCFSARSRDKAGRVSAWSTERCTAVPLDDRSLSASTGWTRGTSLGYYAGTITSTGSSAVSLTRTTLQAKQIVLMASSCSTCGSVSVYLNGVLLKTISLYSATTANKKLFGVAGFTSVHSGTLTLRTNSAKTTRIDGLGVSKV